MPSLEEFVADLARSRLVAPADLKRTRARIAHEPADDAASRLARALIKEGLLTTYQARKVLAGNTKGFFLGGYRILRPLGEGGMGKVYMATHDRDGRRVAVKVLPPSKALEDPRTLERFLREMDLSKRIVHPNIARTLEVGVENGVHYMVMEYIPGDSLYNLIKDEAIGPFRVPDATRFFLKVIDGLNAAHAAGLVHRDIKPSNLMITPDGTAKILDLGLARAMGEESPITQPGAVVGTLDYASPEQLGNASSADARSDLYSVGCSLYFTLAGHPPFEGGDIVNKIFKQRMDDPEPLERVARGVPAAYAAIVRKLMAKNPNDRYQTGKELQADLARWTDPDLVRAILGSEAEAARAFRPPPPELDEDDLRLGADEEGSSPALILRDLGDAEAPDAPMHRPPPPARPAVYLASATDLDDDTLPPLPRASYSDDRWLIRFTIIAAILGILAIALIAAIKSW